MVVTDLLNLIHLASMQAAGGSDAALIETERTMVVSLAGHRKTWAAWQLLLKGHVELGKAPNPAAACEMLIIRLAHAAQMPTPGELMKKLSQTPVTSIENSIASNVPDTVVPAPKTQNAQEQKKTSQVQSDQPNLNQYNPAKPNHIAYQHCESCRNQ